MSLLVFPLLVTHSPAATLLVSNTADSGPGSLRQAIVDNNNANGGNTIVFSNTLSGTVKLTSGALFIARNLTLVGPGPGTLAVDGNGTGRVFHVSSNLASVIITGLTITNGGGFAPGAVLNDHSSLTMSNCVLTGNHTGGIYNDATLSTREIDLFLIACTFRSNTVTGGSGAGIYNNGYQGTANVSAVWCTFDGNAALGSGTVGGAIFNNGNSGNAFAGLSLSTLSTNSANQGGAIWNSGGAGGLAIMNIASSTFSGNSATFGVNNGGSIFNNGAGGSATVQLQNTILQADASGNIANNGGYVSTFGYNLSSDNAGGFLTNANDHINTNPLLGPLTDNGGPTPTHALLPGSPAIDQGITVVADTDQRGAPRPYDFLSITNASAGGGDIGAFELGMPNLNIQVTGNNAIVSWPSYYGDFTLQASTNVALSNSWSTASGPRVVVGTQYQQTNSPVSGTRFFRLRSN